LRILIRLKSMHIPEGRRSAKRKPCLLATSRSVLSFEWKKNPPLWFGSEVLNYNINCVKGHYYYLEFVKENWRYLGLNTLV
jgi:hypothetical protein